MAWYDGLFTSDSQISD
jgi:soluble lytic murein transglycosylase-like protein